MEFVQTQILGMRWLNDLIGRFLNGVNINTSTRLGGSIQFFFYDVIKIFILLGLLIFIISYIQSFFPPERTKQILSRFSGFVANFIAALLGTVTPFCSCSSIPIFIGFTKAGLPVGVTFSFLISSPLVDLGSIILLTSIFNLKVAIAYVVIGLIIAVVGGSMIDKMGMQEYVEKFESKPGDVDITQDDLTRHDRLVYAWEQVEEVARKVFWYVIAGVGIGALIHNWIPTEIIQAVLGNNNPFSVLIAAAIGIPMYADIFGTIPIAEALFSKGIGVGTILSFMMSVTALSLPSLIMLRNAVKPKLLALFFIIVVTGIVIMGYLFNAFQFLMI